MQSVEEVFSPMSDVSNQFLGRILIVDDNQTNLQVLFRILAEAGYQVIPAQGARSALTRLQHQNPDLILLDIMMPEVDGFALYGQLRERPGTAETPVIFISALDDSEAIVRALTLGAVDYITKPFRAEVVLARVARQLQVSGLRRALEAELEERRRLEASLHLAKERAEASNKAKSAFLANMSHELRTPLNAILGFAQIMERDSALPEGQRARAANIRRGGEYLLALINDVLDLAKVEAGRFDCVPRDWETEAFFHQLREMIRPRAEGHGLFLKFRMTETVPPALRCDDIRLRQVLMNLLGNAVKFTERGGITLSADYRGGRLRLEVVDTGIGMAEQELAAIFEPFVQVGALERRAQGTGLGLAISRRLVQAMGGEMAVESMPGKGSRFGFEVPAPAVSKPGAQRSAAALEIGGYRRLAGEGPFRLLLVDDRADNRDALRGMLEPLGFEVAEEASGQACLERVAQAPPDALLLDLRMPHLDGREVARRLRRTPGLEGLKIIAVSAAAFLEDAEEALAAGCDAHVAKPVMLRELLAELGAHLPLQWLQAEEASGPTTADLFPLPEALVRNFISLVRAGNLMGIREFAEKLVADGRFDTTAQHIRRLAHEFAITELLAMSKEYQLRLEREVASGGVAVNSR
jgi:signal transduction histidine kinase